MTPVVAVAGIAFDRAGRVLLVRRGAGGPWSVPGGRVEPGERLAAACVRELLEETGLDVAVAALVEVFERIDGERHYVILDYLVEVKGGELAAASDAAEAGWFTLDEARALTTTEGLIPVLERALVMAGLAPPGRPG